MLERKVEHRLKKKVEELGGFCEKWGVYGLPDRVVGLYGKVWFVELKRPVGGRVSAIQKVRARQFGAAGITIIYLDSYEAIDKFIYEITTAYRLTSVPGARGESYLR